LFAELHIKSPTERVVKIVKIARQDCNIYGPGWSLTTNCCFLTSKMGCFKISYYMGSITSGEMADCD
jgi:hypothetical protein